MQPRWTPHARAPVADLIVRRSIPKMWQLVDPSSVESFVPLDAQGFHVWLYSFGYWCEHCDTGRQPYHKGRRVLPECGHIERIRKEG